MSRVAIALSLLLLACAARVDEREPAPAVLFVQQPVGQVPQVSLLSVPAAPTDGSEAHPFTSLRAALQAAPAGTLLRVGEGVWRERLVISRPVVLLGRGTERTRIVALSTSDIAVLVRGADGVELRGLSIEGGAENVVVEGGSGHRLENVALHGAGVAALIGRNARLVVASSLIAQVAGGEKGRGIDIEGGALEARKLVLRAAGRRAMVLNNARGLLEDLDVRGSSLSALQATDGADVRVVRGTYQGQGGAALYAGGARLAIEGAQVREDEYAVIGYRGAEVEVTGGELTDYRVAGIALVNSHGRIAGVSIARGGSEAAIAITRTERGKRVFLIDNRIQEPGRLGVHVTEAKVTARGNTITGASLDREKDMGDAFYAVDSELLVEENVMRGNAGSGVVVTRSRLQLNGNGFIENGRGGVVLLDRSEGTASGNVFERNGQAGVEVAELSSARLAKNRFGGGGLDIDTGCGQGLAGTAEIDDGNTFAAQMRKRACAQ